MKKKIACLLLVCMFVLTGCCSTIEEETTTESTTQNIMTTTQEATEETSEAETTTETTTEETTLAEVSNTSTTSIEIVDTLINTGTQSFYSSEIFSNRDYETSYNEADYYTITLSDSGSSSTDSTVIISGSTITITQDADYIVTGTLTNGQIVIEASDEDKVQLVLKSVNITNSTSAAINIVSGDKVFITTANESTSTLTSTIVESTSTTDTTNVDAVIFSKSDLTLNGTGTLVINSVDGNGITSKDDLIITCGTYEITSDMHGLEANDTLAIANGTISITAGGGIANISSTSSSSSSNSKGGVSIFDIFSGYSDDETDDTYGKGIKCDTNIYILGGTITIDSLDDAIHSDNVTHIGGGNLEIQTGDDAIHANLETSISGGVIEIITCFEGIEGQRINILGGYIDMYCLDDGINAAISDSSLGDNDLYINIEYGTIIMDTYDEGDGLDSNGDIYVSGGQILISSTTVTTDTALDYQDYGVITGGTFVGTQSDSITIQNFGSDSTQGSILIETSSTQTGVLKLTDSDGNVIVEIEPAKEYEAFIISSPEILLGETYYITAGTESYTVTMDSLIYGEGGGENNSFGGIFSMPGR